MNIASSLPTATQFRAQTAVPSLKSGALTESVITRTIQNDKDVQDRVSPLHLPGENEVKDASDKDKEIREDPRIARYSREKNMAREALERLKEEFRIVRKVWAANPEELAAQLARLGKELAKVVKQYKAAQEALSGLLGNQPGGAVSMTSMAAGMSVSPVSVTSDKEESAESGPDNRPEPERAVPDEMDHPVIASSAFSYGMEAYRKLQVETVRLDETSSAMELRGDIDFAGQARVFATQLRDQFEAGRKWAINLPGHSEEQEKFLNRVGRALKELEADMRIFEGSLRHAMRPAIEAMRPVFA